MSAGPEADTVPGNLRESISICSLRPRIGIRTRKPSELMRSASAGRQTSFTEWPAKRSVDASSDPYEAPKMRMLYLSDIDLSLQGRCDVCAQKKERPRA